MVGQSFLNSYTLICRANYYIARGTLSLAREAVLGIGEAHLSGSMAAALRQQLDEASASDAVDLALARAAGLRQEALRVSLYPSYPRDQFPSP